MEEVFFCSTSRLSFCMSETIEDHHKPKEALSAKIVNLTLHASDYEDIYSREIMTKVEA